jgi:hypothetical protein
MSTKTNPRCFALALLSCLLAGATAEAQKAGAVDAVRPQASIQRSTAEFPAAKGSEVSWNDLLRTDQQGRVRVLLLDQSVISLGPKSEVRVLRQAPASDQSKLELAYGKIRMRLARQAADKRFELRTPTAVAGVIGTDFGADASVPGTTHFICLEGEVRISNSDPKIPRERDLQRRLHDRREGRPASRRAHAGDGGAHGKMAAEQRAGERGHGSHESPLMQKQSDGL